MTAQKGFGVFWLKFWRFLSKKTIKINYQNSGLAAINISALQKEAFWNKKSAARRDSIFDDWDCRIFDRSYF